VTRKMIRRHPHVFADENGVVTSGHVEGNWDRIKAEEKAERAARRPPEASPPSLLSGIKAGQPALTRAMDLQRKASSVGFDWKHVDANPEMALRGANAKFERRFGYIERALAAKGHALESATLEEMDALWDEAKETENTSSSRP
jgi:ATP diphosphatase